MPEATYKLQTVRDVRERAKQQAGHKLALCRERLAQAEAELERRVRLVEECRAEQAGLRRRMLDRAKGGAEARHLLAHRTRLADLRQTGEELIRSADEQRAIVARRAEEAEAAVGELVECAMEHQVIERHHENWRSERRRDDARREQQINDEIGAARHARRNVKTERT